jgi:oligopeptidase B
MTDKHSAINPPICAQKPKDLEIHGDLRTDKYYWLNDRENEEVIDYLKAENSYAEEVLKPLKTFREDLFQEIKGRIKEQDESVPYFKNGYWYYTRMETGKEYPIYCRKKDSMTAEETVLLNVNEMAEGFAYYAIGGLSVSPNNKFLAYGVDTVSRRIYTIYFKNLETGEIQSQTIPKTTGSCTWASDNDYVFYSSKDDQTLRSDKIHRYELSEDKSVVVYEEKDETYNSYVYKSKSREYIIIGSGSTTTTEYRVLKSNDPLGEFKVFQERERPIEYGISHFEDKWYILTNWNAQNFQLMECPLEETRKENWQTVIAHDQNTMLEGIELFKDYMVVEERSKGLNHLKVINLHSDEEYYIPFEEATYTVWSGTNPEFNTEILRFGYTSLTHPNSKYQFNLKTKERELLKMQEIVGGYTPSEYKSERVFVSARDGAEVPVSLVYNKNTDISEKTPLLLYAYGSYGVSVDPYFSSVRLSLLDRGFVFAIAHIRGGEEMGRQWYDSGKLLLKKNTFNDFIDCAEYMIQKKYTSSKSLYAMGGSAGGLLMGAIINMRPNLWNGVVAAVPFVDVVTTMLDETIPLTTGEFDEWGNPKEEEYYHYIKSYSPYDNVEAKDYPNLLVTSGLHDSQVQYWEPAKWVAKLRELKTDNNQLLLKTEMDFGHGGASGRFEQLKEVAMEYVFLLNLADIHD